MPLSATPKGEQATSTILDAAENLFLTQGYHGTSMRHIAQAAGYRSVSALYNHFGDKETLFIALLESRSPYGEIFEAISTVEGDRAEVVLTKIFHQMTEFMDKNISFLQLVLIDYLEFNASHIQKLVGELQENLLHVYSRFEHVNDLRHDVPPIVLLRTVAIQIFGYMMTRLLMPPALLESLTEEKWKSFVVDVLLRGLEKHDND